MKKVISQHIISVLSIILILLSGCFDGKKNVKKKTPTQRVQALVTSGGCIKGRVVDEDGKGFPGVIIKTDPATSTEVTDSKGFFEICYHRKLINAETGETAKAPLEQRSYVLRLSKEGYHAHPVTVNYVGKVIRLNNMVMVEKTRPLPTVVKTKVKEEKRTSGIGGKSPLSE